MLSAKKLQQIKRAVRLEPPAQLARGLDRLAGPLGLTDGEVGQLQQLEGKQLVDKLRDLIRDREARRQAASARRAEGKAIVAAQQLADSACWHGDTVTLDPRVLLGDLLCHPADYIGFAGPTYEPSFFEKAKLRQVKRALRPFGKLSTFLDWTGLHLRWRDGKGGLDLLPQRVSANEQRSALLIRLDRSSSTPKEAPAVPEKAAPAPVEAEMPAAPVTEAPAPLATEAPAALETEVPATIAMEVPAISKRPHRSGAWLGDILVDIGLLS